MNLKYAFLLLVIGASSASGAGFDDRYVALKGDIDSDSRPDIYLRHVPRLVFVDVAGIPTPIAVTRREVGEFVLHNEGNGTFTIDSSLSSGELSALRQWVAADINVIARDINADGFTDVALGGVSDALVGDPDDIYDQIIYAPTASASAPTTLRKVDDDLIQFAEELYHWVVEPSWFYDNAPVEQASQTDWFTLSSLITAGVTFGGLPIVDDPLDPEIPSICTPQDCYFGPWGWVIYATITWEYRDYSAYSLALYLAGFYGAESEIVYQDENGVTDEAAEVIAVMDFMLGTRYTRTTTSLPQVAIPVPIPWPVGVQVETEELGYLELCGRSVS